MVTVTVVPSPVLPKLMPKIDRYAPALFSPPLLGPEDTSVYSTSGAPAGGGAAAFTVMVKAGSETVVAPSLTEMSMFASVPTLATAGVPDSCPVVVLKLAHEGLLAMLKVSVPPLGSVVVGV